MRANSDSTHAAATARSRSCRMRYVLALDQGTTSSRAIVFDATGAIVAIAQQRVPRRSFRSPAGSSTTRREIWAHAVAASRARRSRKAGVAARDIAAIGITNQRETTRRLGPRDRRADRTTRSSGRTGAPRRSATSCARAGSSALIRAQDRAGDRCLLLRHQARAGCSTTCPARARARRARRARVRHGRHLARSGS